MSALTLSYKDYRRIDFLLTSWFSLNLQGNEKGVFMLCCALYTLSFNFYDKHMKTVIIILMFQIGKWMAWEIRRLGFSLGTGTELAEYKARAPSITNTVSEANIKQHKY